MSTKAIAKKLFYDEGLTITEIANELDVSKQAISKHLLEDNKAKYEKEKNKRKITEWKKTAVRLFYDEGLKIKEIAKEVNKSSAAVSKYLSTDNPEKYNTEKTRRKKESTRRKSTSGTDYELLKRQHILDVGVLSYERIY